MLLTLKSTTERIVKQAMPEFRLFRYRPDAFELQHLPFIHVFFDEDKLLERRAYSDLRQVRYELEVCFKPKLDAEAEIMGLLDQIEHAFRQDKELRELSNKIDHLSSDFAHKKIGEDRIAALLMVWRIEYLKPYQNLEGQRNG